MPKLPHLARIALGLFFLTFGLNGFFGFLPQPDHPPAAGEFLGALAATGYFFVFLKLTETFCGLLLLSGRFVPLALVVLAPVVLNILLFHLFLAPAGILPGAFAAVVGSYLAWAYRDHFQAVLRPDAQPAIVGASVQALPRADRSPASPGAEARTGSSVESRTPVPAARRRAGSRRPEVGRDSDKRDQRIG